MKSLISVLLQMAKDRPSRLNIIVLLRFFFATAALVGVYSVIFHYIMEYEGRSESWITGIYWTLTVMSTLGFGDITFTSDLGRIFSAVVLLSGIIFLLVLLPFTFIEFFYAPWMKAQQAARAPRQVSHKLEGHIVLTAFDAISKSLIKRIQNYHYDYVLIVPDLQQALHLHDMGYKIMVGDLDDPETYRLARVEHAALVASTSSDQINANVAFTVREVSETVMIIATASFSASVDLLELAGCNQVLQPANMIGQTLARQVASGASRAHIIGSFDDLKITEAAVRGTPLVDKTLLESNLRVDTGVNVLGTWERGHFQTAMPDTVMNENTILVMAGTEEQIKRYNQLYCRTAEEMPPVIIIGGGRVGRAAARALKTKGVDYRIVERTPERIRDPEKYVLGDGAELQVLHRAGIRKATSIIITTHDDDMNVYLTIYCRRLRPDAQIISRTALDRNVATLHRAGADFVMSYASTGANAIINLMGRDNILMVAEGLDVFEVPIPDSLVGKTLAETDIRERTGCTVIALHINGGSKQTLPMPDPHEPLPPNVRLILIGELQAEKCFLDMYK
ncbi:MAG: potassium channel protein [Anaerolineaceae bacterium]|nr:MAG: potassium channel protein [Anaerolineaceae bacterium]